QQPQDRTGHRYGEVACLDEHARCDAPAPEEGESNQNIDNTAMVCDQDETLAGLRLQIQVNKLKVRHGTQEQCGEQTTRAEHGTSHARLLRLASTSYCLRRRRGSIPFSKASRVRSALLRHPVLSRMFSR